MEYIDIQWMGRIVLYVYDAYDRVQTKLLWYRNNKANTADNQIKYQKLGGKSCCKFW